MKLNAREKLLALFVGLLAVVMVMIVGLTSIVGTFQSKSSQIANLTMDLEDLNRVVTRGSADAGRFTDYEARSLPPNVLDARSAYQEWLIETVHDHFGDDTPVSFRGSSTSIGKTYVQLSYRVSATGNVKQLTQFLYGFYAVDTLHRISRLDVHASEGTKELRVNMEIDALSLPTAENTDEWMPRPGDRFTYEEHELDDYLDSIVNRNVFGSANRPPEIVSSSRVSGTTRQPIPLTIRARDDDELDLLSFQLEEAPDEARISRVDDRTARVSWVPPEAGPYQLTVLVTDDGFPPETAIQTIQVQVADPRPVDSATKPSFDVARYTMLTAVVQGSDGRAQVWLHEKPTGTVHELFEGDVFDIGTVSGVVREIRSKDRDVVLEVDGKPWRLTMGQSLMDAKEVQQEGS